MRYQESLDNEFVNEERTAHMSRPSIFYSGFEHSHMTKFQPCLRNVSRYFWRFWFCITGSTKYKRIIRKRTTRFGVNSRSKLDILARIVFPVSFVLFNILYWLYFLHFQR